MSCSAIPHFPYPRPVKLCTLALSCISSSSEALCTATEVWLIYLFYKWLYYIMSKNYTSQMYPLVCYEVSFCMTSKLNDRKQQGQQANPEFVPVAQILLYQCLWSVSETVMGSISLDMRLHQELKQLVPQPSFISEPCSTMPVLTCRMPSLPYCFLTWVTQWDSHSGLVHHFRPFSPSWTDLMHL